MTLALIRNALVKELFIIPNPVTCSVVGLLVVGLLLYKAQKLLQNKLAALWLFYLRKFELMASARGSVQHLKTWWLDLEC